MMIYEKRYLQFNDLVFDGYDMISDYNADISFKSDTQPYSFGHGSYAPLKNPYLLVREASVSMTISLKLRKIPCEDRAYYVRFAEEELSKPGRLWAIKNNEIVWAYAYVTSLSQVISMRKDEVTYDIEFMLPEGIWHKADKMKTFLLPYSACIFMECKGYKTLNPCITNGVDCCSCSPIVQRNDVQECFCCCVDEITEDMMLCKHLDELQAFYSCETPYQLVYSCEYAEKFNHNLYLGQQMCADDICENAVISGRFYSETDIPTKDMVITLRGDMHDPSITINGNTNVIKGDYSGSLIISASGDVYYSKDDCCSELLEPSVWSVPYGNIYGWTVNPRENALVVNLNACCGEIGIACVWIDTDNITL